MFVLHRVALCQTSYGSLCWQIFWWGRRESNPDALRQGIVERPKAPLDRFTIPRVCQFRHVPREGDSNPRYGEKP